MSGCGGGCDRLVMVVGGGGCWRRAVCVYAWSSFVVRLLFRGRCGRLWPFVFVGVVVCGRCLWSLWAVVAVRSVGGVSVVVCLDGGGKEKSNHVTLPNKHCLLSVTNK